MGIIGMGTALASPHVGPYSNCAHGLRSYPTLKALGQNSLSILRARYIHEWTTGKGKGCCATPYECKESYACKPTRALSLLMIRFKNHPLPMPPDQMCV
jgi:hypothetical protein